MPRYDSSALFARLLDPKAGHWSISPVGSFSTERRYLPGTLVIETTFTTDTGSVRLTDTANDEQLGNFPQAFSHIGLITAANAIDKAREGAA